MTRVKRRTAVMMMEVEEVMKREDEGRSGGLTRRRWRRGERGDCGNNNDRNSSLNTLSSPILDDQ